MKNPFKGESRLYQILTYSLFGGVILVALMHLSLAIWRFRILMEQMK